MRFRALSWWPRGGGEEVLREHEQIYEACLAGQIERPVELAS